MVGGGVGEWAVGRCTCLHEGAVARGERGRKERAVVEGVEREAVRVAHRRAWGEVVVQGQQAVQEGRGRDVRAVIQHEHVAEAVVRAGGHERDDERFQRHVVGPGRVEEVSVVERD